MSVHASIDLFARSAFKPIGLVLWTELKLSVFLEGFKGRYMDINLLSLSWFYFRA